MVIERGQIWWADLGEPRGSIPAYRRPVLVVQTNEANQSKIATTLVVVITSNLLLAEAKGNVLITAIESGLDKDSVVNVSQFVTLNKTDLSDYSGTLPLNTMIKVDDGLRRILSLD